ncbi:hypothetical protein CMI48_00790 [Candidatus Pacearchaeota archaeon]|nr:hypothetical protein [Candidatus Pacearchaeota archaeon]
MVEKIREFFFGGDSYKREFKRQLKTLILITLGFTIAFTWRQTTFDTSQSIVQFFLNLQNSTTASIVTSVFITLISLIIIWFTSHILRDRRGY